jgi:DNA invertase Pin-like site-specific DNA recombinase
MPRDFARDDDFHAPQAITDAVFGAIAQRFGESLTQILKDAVQDGVNDFMRNNAGRRVFIAAESKADQAKRYADRLVTIKHLLAKGVRASEIARKVHVGRSHVYRLIKEAQHG